MGGPCTAVSICEWDSRVRLKSKRNVWFSLSGREMCERV